MGSIKRHFYKAIVKLGSLLVSPFFLCHPLLISNIDFINIYLAIVLFVYITHGVLQII